MILKLTVCAHVSICLHVHAVLTPQHHQMYSVPQTYVSCHHPTYKVWELPLLNKAQCHENVSGSGGIAVCIIDLGTGWRWVISFMLHLLYP